MALLAVFAATPANASTDERKRASPTRSWVTAGLGNGAGDELQPQSELEGRIIEKVINSLRKVLLRKALSSESSRGLTAANARSAIEAALGIDRAAAQSAGFARSHGLSDLRTPGEPRAGENGYLDWIDVEVAFPSQASNTGLLGWLRRRMGWKAELGFRVYVPDLVASAAGDYPLRELKHKEPRWYGSKEWGWHIPAAQDETARPTRYIKRRDVGRFVVDTVTRPANGDAQLTLLEDPRTGAQRTYNLAQASPPRTGLARLRAWMPHLTRGLLERTKQALIILSPRRTQARAGR